MSKVAANSLKAAAQRLNSPAGAVLAPVRWNDKLSSARDRLTFARQRLNLQTGSVVVWLSNRDGLNHLHSGLVLAGCRPPGSKM